MSAKGKIDFSATTTHTGASALSTKMRIDVKEDPTEIRRSLEKALHDVASNDPPKSEQFYDEFASTVESMEQAIFAEIAQQEHYASSLLRSIELTIPVPGEHSPQLETDFRQAAQAQVHNSKLLSVKAKEVAQALLDVSRLADTKISTDITFEKTVQERLLFEPWAQSSFTKLVVLFSDVFEALRDLKEAASASGKAGVWVAPDSFERKTTKYWVPEENLPELLMTCASEAPFLVYGKTGRLSRAEDIPLDDLWKNLSSKISSIYFDSPSLALYKERIKRREGAQLLRARWYGEKPPKPDQPVFLELKTHHESWIFAKSVKERVAILERDMNAFLYSMDSVMSEGYAESLVLAATPKLKGEKLAKAIDLLIRSHTLVVRHKLRPCVRSTYDRLAFQSSKSNSLRLTLDRKVVVSDERGCKQGEQWYVPFEPYESKPDGSDRRTIPFAVFEIKLGEGQESTALNECIDNGTILDAAKFSKFLTGAATFNTVNHLPYWADHPAFQTFFYQASALSSSKLSSLRDVPYNNDGEISLTASCSSNTVGSRRDRNDRKSSKKVLPFLPQRVRGNAFVAPKKAVRIEPKTYFANERTFIQWVSAALFLVTTSAILLEAENGEGYAKLTATTLLIFALIIAIYAVGLYYFRLWLLTNARPYGYISHFGPFVLTGAAIAGTWVILRQIRLVEFQEEIERSVEEAKSKAFVQADPGVCMEHDISSFSPLEFEPSDALMDLQRNQLLVPSLSEIYGFPLPEWNSEGVLEIPNVSSSIVAQVELADFEAITLVDDDTLYAVSEIDITTLEQSAQMYSFERGDFGRFEVTGQWKLETPEPEGMAMITEGKSSSLLVSGQIGEGPLSAFVKRFEVPEPNGMFNDILNSTPTLEASRNRNERLLDSDMEDPKIGAMTYFEGVLYVLHRKAKVVRAWDMESGTFRAEWALPGVPDSKGKQWQGLAFQRIERPGRATSIERSTAYNPKNNLRRRRVQTIDKDQEEREIEDNVGGNDEEEEVDTSVLVLHLTHDTPAAIWSIVVKEGDVKGSIEYPPCADVFR
ncbi:unnamed protein product [Cylindrotheca closterium]|uniref:SPX domain-containing protein n=1 Tax=Cylindrotheca closterium TaxID=2856 RepID=A0AAD2GBL6_9STRA|nr:unnamed protein product [Cylindrotheca closterium]